ncbi:hypothetical protein F5878DRAFT_609710 [Lentinula raphanica]|uniref:Uncharacterized protein n=1 Tax=Lentinula raphanica TaxID=153919 RepID=A0AA38UHW2_9AGAR|nr:hypothetical protein F5880DRAFT_8892 [Lentinula raphanica]KAJ3841651.1 hypothetical protein F5878DRAFT_609710 [Lentinula raphanica]
MKFLAVTSLTLALSTTALAKPFPRQETSLLSSSASLTSSMMPGSTAASVPPSGNQQAAASPNNNATFADCAHHVPGNNTSGTPIPSSGTSTTGLQARQGSPSSMSVLPTTSSINGGNFSSVVNANAAGCPPPAEQTSVGAPSPSQIAVSKAETSLSVTTTPSLSSAVPSATTPSVAKAQNSTAQAIAGDNSTSTMAMSSATFATVADDMTSTASSSVETAA